ncbi:MAG: hypothetical protein SGJ04_08415 [Bacteroidota bacterium]|nr:hypothetical protein [Bacteroidota bacterium]
MKRIFILLLISALSFCHSAIAQVEYTGQFRMLFGVNMGEAAQPIEMSMRISYLKGIAMIDNIAIPEMFSKGVSTNALKVIIEQKNKVMTMATITPEGKKIKSVTKLDKSNEKYNPSKMKEVFEGLKETMNKQGVTFEWINTNETKKIDGYTAYKTVLSSNKVDVIFWLTKDVKNLSFKNMQGNMTEEQKINKADIVRMLEDVFGKTPVSFTNSFPILIEGDMKDPALKSKLSSFYIKFFSFSDKVTASDFNLVGYKEVEKDAFQNELQGKGGSNNTTPIED